MPRRILLVILFMIVGCLLVAQETPLILPLPQFDNPFYDSYSRNYLSASAAGRGYTGVAELGNIDSALLNPASNLPDSTSLMVEMDIKPPIEAQGYPMYADYTSPVPFGLLGLTGNLGKGFSGGIMYNVIKSISLNDYSFYINMGEDFVQRFPSYNLNQVTANLCYHQNNLHVGLNLHNQIHYTDDPIFMRSYDRVRDYQYSYRIQPGIIYSLGAAKLGLTLMPPTKFNWDLKYTTYDALAPLWLSTGVSLSNPQYTGLLDAEWEQTSAIDSHFKDRFTVKVGGERHYGTITYRLGYHYTSNVYDGYIRLASNEAQPDTSIFWNFVPDSLYVKNNSQHSITVGLSYYHRSGSINIGAMQTVVADVPKTQISLSLSFYLSTFTRKKQLYLYD